LLLFKSSPFGSVSHSHADQNTFCILKGGRALAIPSGYYGLASGMPHHVQWTRSTKANNCILVNGKGQPTQERKASGYIKAFDYRQDCTYVAGDATAAYMGQLTRFTRHILFLSPGFFLLLDELEAPDPAIFQWMLHAFEEFEIEDSVGRILSTREGASLEAYLQSPAGLTFSQTDQFDTPYNEGVPQHLQNDAPNQWHLTVETKEKCKSIRIGAIMGVWGPDEPFELEMLENSDGWFGAQGRGAFGQVEGWIQLLPNKTGPKDYGKDVAEGKTYLASEIVAKLAGATNNPESAFLSELTDREREVLDCMARGLANAAIAEELFIQPRTVERHIGSIFSKMRLQPQPRAHARVLAVLAYLQDTGRLKEGSKAAEGDGSMIGAIGMMG
jgi:DNA-binding CsgD family transcriptional regulator